MNLIDNTTSLEIIEKPEEVDVQSVLEYDISSSEDEKESSRKK